MHPAHPPPHHRVQCPLPSSERAEGRRPHTSPEVSHAPRTPVPRSLQRGTKATGCERSQNGTRVELPRASGWGPSGTQVPATGAMPSLRRSPVWLVHQRDRTPCLTRSIMCPCGTMEQRVARSTPVRPGLLPVCVEGTHVLGRKEGASGREGDWLGAHSPAQRDGGGTARGRRATGRQLRSAATAPLPSGLRKKNYALHGPSSRPRLSAWPRAPLRWPAAAARGAAPPSPSSAPCPPCSARPCPGP